MSENWTKPFMVRAPAVPLQTVKLLKHHAMKTIRGMEA
jgi:hypothetical protein